MSLHESIIPHIPRPSVNLVSNWLCCIYSWTISFNSFRLQGYPISALAIRHLSCSSSTSSVSSHCLPDPIWFIFVFRPLILLKITVRGTCRYVFNPLETSETAFRTSPSLYLGPDVFLIGIWLRHVDDICIEIGSRNNYFVST